MTTSTAAPGPSANMTHRTPAGHKRNTVREMEEGISTNSLVRCLRTVNKHRNDNSDSLVGSDEMMLMKEAQIH